MIATVKCRDLTVPVLALLAAGCAAFSGDGSVILAQEGKSRAVIRVLPAVMAPNAPEPPKNPEREAELQRRRLRESVKDLALYLGKISGAKVEIAMQSPAAGDARLPIYVGELAVREFGEVGKSYPYQQAFRVVVSDRGIGLMGESDLAASYAIYELLDQLGCRWYMPSALGEVIPRMDTLTLPKQDLRSAPGTIYRGIWYADDDYKRRNRMGGLLLQAGHALELMVAPEEAARHPEWTAVDAEGKPVPGRYKWSSESFAHAVAGKVLDQDAKNPQPSWSISPEDGARFDQSPEEKALDAGDVDTTFGTVSLTDRYMVLCNRIAARVAARKPDLLLGFLAYVQYIRPPVREPVHPNLVPMIAPITYSRAHPMDDDRVPDNRELRAIVEGWARKVPRTSHYFYAYFLAETSAPCLMLAKWGHDVPYVLQKGNCAFWQPETMPNFEIMMHALYMANRLAWDPALKPEEIYREIDERFYGSAAREMTAYWEFVDRVWTGTPEYSGCCFGYLRRWTPERLKEARRLLDRALKAARAPEERFRIGMADDSLKLFERFMKLRYDLAEGRFGDLAAQAEAWRKEVVALGEKYKEQYAFTRVYWAPQTASGDYFALFCEPAYKDASRIVRDCRMLTPVPLRSFKYRADPEKAGEQAGWAKPEFNDSGWKTTDVCTETWSSLGYHGYFKSFWYRATVKVPEVPAGKKIYLWLASTDGSAKVFVNGKPVPYEEGKPQAEGYCRPFSFDITGAVKPGEANSIAILCTRPPLNELGTGGLLGPVEIYGDK